LAFVEEICAPPTRVPGTAVFPHPTNQTVPLALRAMWSSTAWWTTRRDVSVVPRTCAHPRNEPSASTSLEHSDDASCTVRRFGFQDDRHSPHCGRPSLLTSELDFDPDAAFYFLSRITSKHDQSGCPCGRSGCSSACPTTRSPATYFRLPVDEPW